MTRKFLAVTAIAAAAITSVGMAAPASAGTHAYYQQVVSGSGCQAAGDALAAQKRAEGYLVTWTGCRYDTSAFTYVGVVGWSDGR